MKATIPVVPVPVNATIHLFTVHGATFTFRGCEILLDNETTLAFTYRAQSDGRPKTMTAIKANLAGHSTAVEPT